MQHFINRAKRESSSKTTFSNFTQGLVVSQYFELVIAVVYGYGVIDQVSMWLESLREGSSKRSEGVVRIHYITDSRAQRSGALCSFRESAFRGIIGGSIDSQVYSIFLPPPTVYQLTGMVISVI